MLAPLSTSSGEQLEHRVGESSAVQRHAQLGDMLIWWVVPLAVLAAVLYWWHRSNRAGRALAVAVAVLPVLVAVGTLVQVVLIGHSGAQSAWGQVGSASSSSHGEAEPAGSGQMTAPRLLLVEDDPELRRRCSPSCSPSEGYAVEPPATASAACTSG